jgi:hypothetical protein
LLVAALTYGFALGTFAYGYFFGIERSGCVYTGAGVICFLARAEQQAGKCDGVYQFHIWISVKKEKHYCYP